MESNVRQVLRDLYPERSGLKLRPGTEIQAGVYLRQSTVDGQNFESVEEQLEFIRHRLASNQVRSVFFSQCKIVIADELIYLDRGKTGRVGRENYDAFKNAIQLGDFKIGLVYDLSRLTRELGSLLDAYDLAQAYNVELISISESISSHSDGARIHFIAKGMANEMQSESTSRQTRRGLELRVLSGKSTGHNPYGFKSVSEHPDRVRQPNEPANRLVIIDEDAAKVVRKVFDMYDATDVGVDGIAKLFNKEGLKSPKNGRWGGRTVYNMLNQPKYIGVWIHGRTCIKRDGARDRLIQVERPQNEWIIQTREKLRIIPQDLWERVQAKMRKIEITRRSADNTSVSIWGKNRGAANHLFTGTMKCGECGGNFISMSGKGSGYFGCQNAYRKGICQNRSLVQTSWIDSTFMGLIREWVEDPKSLDRVCKVANERLKQRLSSIPDKIMEVQKELNKVTQSLANLVEFVATGKASSSIAEAIEKAEDRKQSLEAKLRNLKAREPHNRFLTPYAVKPILCNIGEILTQDVARANAYFKGLFPEPITMNRKQDGRSTYYEAAGKVNLTRLFRFATPVNGVPSGI